MFRFWFGDKKNQQVSPVLSSPPPPALDLKALREAEAARANRTAQALAQGRLPDDAKARMERQKSGQLPWTSDLSVSEWAGLRAYRFRPLGQVMGSSFYHVGYVPNGLLSYYTNTHEMRAPTQAMYEGRRLALERMEQEAIALGAHAVVGVDLKRSPFQLQDDVVEFSCFGTAVTLENVPLPSRPILCSVSGQDLVRLLARGVMPIGLALGASFYYVRTDFWDLRQERSFYNQEMGHFSRAVNEIRRTVTHKLHEDAKRLGGTGVVGGDFSFHVEEIAGGTTNDDQEIIDHILQALMVGTVISHVPQMEMPVAPKLAITLNDGLIRGQRGR